jgi:hypothetical protein
MKNPRIRPFMSGAFVGTVPAEIPPLTKNEETQIVRTLLTELNIKFCVNLDSNPSFEHNVPPPFTEHNAGQTVFIGASNLGKIAKAAAENGHMVVDLTSGGWTPKSGKIKKLCETLEKLNLTEFDTVIIDLMSNSAFLGTDEDGLPIPAEKFEEDGRYHLYGDLQLAPPPLCLQILPETNGKSVYICGWSKSRLHNTITKVCPVHLLQRRWTIV